MSFSLVHKSLGYSDYLIAKNTSGLCFGASSVWMMDLLQGRKSSLYPPNPHDGLLLKYHRTLTLLWRKDIGEKNILENLGRQASFKTKVRYEVKSEKDYFGILQQNIQLKKSINNMVSNRNENVFCLMIWRFKDGRGHAVVSFKNKADGALYYYDPNYGVFEWEGGAGSFYHDVKHWMTKKYSDSYLSMALFINSNESLMINRNHVTI